MAQLDLPAYEASKSEDFPGFLIVWCPRERCPSYQKRPFVVHEHTWMRPQVLTVTSQRGHKIRIVGRSCPYCFATARLPSRASIR
jgi:hypothetical protein